MELPYDPAIPLLGIYTKELKAETQTGICTHTFITALFTIAKSWKQPKCPLTDEWINKILYIYYIHTYIFQPLKRNEILTHATI